MRTQKIEAPPKSSLLPRYRRFEFVKHAEDPTKKNSIGNIISKKTTAQTIRRREYRSRTNTKVVTLTYR